MNYGADPTFLPWGNDWKTSRPYIGLNGPDWASLDLFVNNGGLSEWNALVNVDDGGTSTDHENTVYCRVRNVGDQAANDVAVTFEYARIVELNGAIGGNATSEGLGGCPFGMVRTSGRTKPGFHISCSTSNTLPRWNSAKPSPSRSP